MISGELEARERGNRHLGVVFSLTIELPCWIDTNDIYLILFDACIVLFVTATINN